MSITDIESRSETTYRTVPSVGPSTLVPSISHLNEGELPETAFGQFLIDRGAEISGEPTMDGQRHVVPLMVDGRQVDAQYRALDPQTPDGDFTGELRTADGKLLGLWVGREDGLTLEEQLHARDVSGQELEERELVGRADRDEPVGAPDRPAGQASAAAGQKTYLAVPFAEKDAAKAAGALWDKKAGAWFVKGSEIPEELFRFMPSDHEVLGSEDPRTAFGKFLRDNGAELQGLPEMDGKWHRIALAGDGKETNASYRGFLDGVPNGQFKNFKGDDVPLQWISKGDALSPEEKQRLVAEAAQNRENRERVRATEQEATAKRAFGIWTNLKSWATPENCPYLAWKNVRGYGVKVADDGRMVVPLRDENGRIWSLQFVGEDKIYLKHGRKDGLFHTIDPSKDLENGRDKGDKLTIIIGEGYATGADVHKATNLPTAVAFDGDNLVATAKAVREKFPKANLLIAADDDHHLPNRTPPLPNKGLKCAQRAAEAVGGKVLAPSFTPAEKERGATDWNDLKQIRGEKGLLTALRDSFVQMQREHARSLGKDKGLGRERELSR